MRFLLNLLAVCALIHSIFAQSAPHDIHCFFHNESGLHTCFLNDTRIITETVPLRFFNVHPPNHNDSSVERIHTWMYSGTHINIRVFHPQLMQQFPNVQLIEFIGSRLEILLPDSLGRCDKLIGLTLDRNIITSIPSRVFENCTKLRTLSLNVYTQMRMDSESFYGLQNLEVLRIGRILVANTTFEYLPKIRRLQITNIIGIEANALRHMTQLETIAISDSVLSLSLIQDAIDGMGSLLSISLNRNRYTSVDYKFFGQFDKLEEFELIGNQLTTIPANSFKNYRNLRILRLNSNHISLLTEESFLGLHSLETLTLNHNRLDHLPPNAFHELMNLRFLELSNNVIPTIDKDAFKGLQSLDTLLINDIQLWNPIAGMFEPLHNLQVLQIARGNISSIPPSIFSPMKILRNLHLSSNRITRLNSNSFGYLPLLETFFISNSMVSDGLQEIERTFFANFPRLVQFGGSGSSCNRNINGVVNMTLIDFEGRTVFDECFSNWDATITTTSDPNPTPPIDSATAIGITKFLFLIILIRVLVL